MQSIYEQIKNIPFGSEYYANRYDTDDEYVLHLWKDNQSYDIRIKKEQI